MFRGYAIYVTMFALLIGGLWLILLYGSALSAPQDVSGAWDVAWRTAPPGTRDDVGPEAPAVPDRMRIEQSGRFCTITFEPGPRLGMKMVEGTLLHGGGDDKSAQRGGNATLLGDGWQMSIARAYGGELHVDLARGNERYSGVAKRPPPDEVAGASSKPPAAVVAESSHGSR